MMPAPHRRSTSTPWAVPTTCRLRRPWRTSSRSKAIGSRQDRPPPMAMVIPSCTMDAASASDILLSSEVKTGIIGLLVHLHLTFSGLVCILLLKRPHKHCPFSTRLRVLKLIDCPTPIYNQHVPCDEIGLVRSKVDRSCCDIFRLANTSPGSHINNLLA